MDNEAAESSETEVTAAEVEETAEEVESKDVVVEAEETKSEEKETPKRRFGRKSKSKKADNGEEEVDLAKMKKRSARDNACSEQGNRLLKSAGCRS